MGVAVSVAVEDGAEVDETVTTVELAFVVVALGSWRNRSVASKFLPQKMLSIAFGSVPVGAGAVEWISWVMHEKPVYVLVRRRRGVRNKD